MNTLFILLSTTIFNMQLIIFDFNPKTENSGWRIVDDVVMGGRSAGNFEINNEGHAVFSGNVSLENNGGFSSVRYRLPEKVSVNSQESFTIRVKGDGKRYQFRVKTDQYDRHSYISYFKTTGDWQEIEIPMETMYPSFRGMKLNMENYPGERVAEMAFLIANNKAESFKLEIDWIGVK